MIEPGSGTGTLFASAEGEAIGGSAGASASALSLVISSLDGFGFGSVGAFLFSARRTETAGVGDGEALGSSGVRPFSSSSSLPTSFDEVSPTSLSAAKTDAPRAVTSVPPSDIQDFRLVTPPDPKSDIYWLADPSGMMRTL